MVSETCFFCGKQPGEVGVGVQVLGKAVAVCPGCLGNLVGNQVASLHDWFMVVRNNKKRERLLEEVGKLVGRAEMRPEEISVEIPTEFAQRKKKEKTEMVKGKEKGRAPAVRPRPKFRWVGGQRVSVEDGCRLLKTNEAAAMLGVSVKAIRQLVRAGRLPMRGTYATLYPGVRGWLVSSNDVATLQGDAEVVAARKRLRKWHAARIGGARKAPLPACQVRPLRRPARLRPDPWQERAVEAAASGKDVLVVAPTGSGKTWVAEDLARRALEEGTGLIYASPIKALSNQKYLEFCSRFGSDHVGIVTGDISINPDAPVVVATTEIVRNWCVLPPGKGNSRTALRGARWVVVDEFHLLDSDRGMAWEEVVLSAPADVGLVCLSATVPNWDEVAAWISEVRGKPVEVVVEERRPVSLSWRWWVKSRAVTAPVAAREIERLRERKEERRLARVQRSWRCSDDSWDRDWDEDWDGDEEWDDG